MIENLLNDLPEINVDSEYWFVRTDSGDYFDTFFKNSFIAIGWNDITLQDLRTLPPDQVKAKIFQIFSRDESQDPVPATVTGTYTKLQRFLELKKGDKIIILLHQANNQGRGLQ